MQKNYSNIEVINIEIDKGKMYAYISYQDINDIEYNINNGYNVIRVPINIRELKYSIRGNLLCNQSIDNNIDN